MWKIVVGFVLFAALGLYVLSRGGDIDMGGEKHGDTSPVVAPAVDAPASAPAISSAANPVSAVK